MQPLETVDAAQLKLTEPAEIAAVNPVGAAGALVHEVDGEPVPVGEVVPVVAEDPVVFPADPEPPQPTNASPRLVTRKEAPRNFGLRLCMGRRISGWTGHKGCRVSDTSQGGDRCGN